MHRHFLADPRFHLPPVTEPTPGAGHCAHVVAWYREHQKRYPNAKFYAQRIRTLDTLARGLSSYPREQWSA